MIEEKQTKRNPSIHELESHYHLHFNDLPEIAEIPGLVGEIADYIVSTARKPQPEMAIAAALVAVATIAGRRIAIGDPHTRTNIMCACASKTGTGKNHPREVIQQLLEASGAGDCIGEPELASGAAIEERLANVSPVAMYPIDEAARMFSLSGDSRNNNMYDIVTKLLTLSTSAGIKYRGKGLANWENRRVTQEPCLCCLFTATEDLWSSMGESGMTNGLIPRAVYFEGRDVPKQRPIRDPSRFKRIADRMKEWVSHKPFIEKGNLASWVSHPDATCIGFGKGVDMMIDDLDAYEFTMTHGRPSMERAPWTRYVENSIKLGGVIAAGCHRPYENFQIELEHMFPAARIACASIELVNENVENLGSDTVYSRAHRRVADYLKQHASGESGVRLAVFSRHLQTINRKTRMEILASMQEAALVDLKQMKSDSGRPPKIIHWLGDNEHNT